MSHHSDVFQDLGSRRVEAGLLKAGVRSLPKDEELFILDFDATDTPLHGQQEGRFFHGYYDQYCYLPLDCFCGPVVLWSQLRTGARDASEGTVEALEKIVPAIRQRYPKARIVVRGDSGFARDAIMSWCGGQRDVFYLLGKARNTRLQTMIEKATVHARMRSRLTGVSCREYVDTTYRTLTSWSRERRMLAKAEVLVGDKGNPRFVVRLLCLSDPRTLAGHGPQRLDFGQGDIGNDPSAALESRRHHQS